MRSFYTINKMFIRLFLWGGLLGFMSLFFEPLYYDFSALLNALIWLDTGIFLFVKYVDQLEVKRYKIMNWIVGIVFSYLTINLLDGIHFAWTSILNHGKHDDQILLIKQQDWERYQLLYISVCASACVIVSTALFVFVTPKNNLPRKK